MGTDPRDGRARIADPGRRARWLGMMPRSEKSDVSGPVTRACRASAWVSVFLLWGSAACTATASPTRPIDLFDLGAPSFTNFSVRDGVPDAVISSVQTDRDGFVWLASSQGLARYDGRRWDAVDPPAIGGVLGALTLDHEGTLWAAFRDRGIARFDGKVWHFDDRSTGLPTDHARRVVEFADAQGHLELWATTMDGGLLQRRAGRWIRAPYGEQLPAAILSVARTHAIGGRERTWAGSGNNGLWFREDGDWRPFQAPGFTPAQIESMLVTDEAGREQLWISTFGEGLWRLDESGLRSWTVAAHTLPSNDVYDIAQTRLPDGGSALWVATRGGLVRIQNEHVRVFDREHGLPSGVIRSLSTWRSPDGIDVLWIATENGVSRTFGGSSAWRTATLMGARGSGVFGLLIEPDGLGGERLWVASDGDGLGLYEHGEWRASFPGGGSPGTAGLRMVKRIDDGRGSALWVARDDGRLLRAPDGTHFVAVDVPWPLRPGEAVLDMLARTYDGARETWVATRESGLYRWREGIWTAIRPAGIADSWRATGLYEQRDRSGRSWLWAATSKGLLRFDGEHAVLLRSELGSGDLSLLGIDMIADAAGRPVLWLGTVNRGILRVDVGDPLHPQALPPDLPAAPDPTAYSAHADSQGRIYICTNNGVQMLTSIRGGYSSRVFTRADGMVHDECNTNAQFVDAHDRFWTGTLGGVTVFDPDYEVRDREPKPLRLTHVRLDSRLVDGSEIRVPPGRHELRVEFGLLSWQRESESVFRTQLLALESSPGAWSDNNARTFDALSPGMHTLRIEGRDYAGNPSTPLAVQIRVVPAWWQRTESRIGLGLAALLLGYALLQSRTYALKAQRRRLEAEVRTRTAELHEANARLVDLSYRDALTGLANRRRLLEALEGDVAGDTVGLIFVDVDHFKAYNDRFGHPAGDEALREVGAAIHECLPGEALAARYGGEEFACLVPGANLERTRVLAECIRVAVRTMRIAVPGTADWNQVTISAGVASQRVATAADAHRLLRNADTALYRAKSEGRNCVRG